MASETQPIRAADHIGFAVASLDEALPFWTEAFGARLVRTVEPDGAFLHRVTGTHAVDARVGIVELAGQTVELLEFRGGPIPQGPATAPFEPGGVHLALIVDDPDALLDRVASYGWLPRGTPQPISSGSRQGMRVIYVTGPDGASIEFMEPPN